MEYNDFKMPTKENFENLKKAYSNQESKVEGLSNAETLGGDIPPNNSRVEPSPISTPTPTVPNKKLIVPVAPTKDVPVAFNLLLMYSILRLACNNFN